MTRVCGRRVLNHVSTYFSDVVWTGISTRHMHQSFAAAITQDDLRDFWAPISPATYYGRLMAAILCRY